MKNILLTLCLLTLPLASVAQDEPVQTGSTVQSVATEGKTVTITAKGLDVRSVLYDLFQQTGHNFVIDQGVRYVLYLNLAKVEFDEAFKVVLKQADLGFEVKNDIYYIGKNRPKNFSVKIDKAATTPPVEHKTTQPEEHKATQPVGNKTTGTVTPPPLPISKNTNPDVPKLPGGTTTGQTGTKLTLQDLQKRLTTRMAMADIKDVFNEFAKQTGFTIELDPKVPAYKLDAYLINTSLKYALDVVTEATKLEYVLTDKGTIKIEPKQ